LIEAFPNASPYEIKAKMMNAARPLEVRGATQAIRQAENSVFTVGAGFVQPLEALTSSAFATVRNTVPHGENSASGMLL